MTNLHTGESLNIIYRIGDMYVPEALDKLNYFLRDHNTQDVSSYDPKEFDVLHAMMARLGKLGQRYYGDVRLQDGGDECGAAA